MRQSNDESIHQHNAHAEREVTMGHLRSELNGDRRYHGEHASGRADDD
jgi:GTP cyclohydrolase-4